MKAWHVNIRFDGVSLIYDENPNNKYDHSFIIFNEAKNFMSDHFKRIASANRQKFYKVKEIRKSQVLKANITLS